MVRSILALVIVLTVMSCSRDANTPAPLAVSLVFPTKDTTTIGTAVSDTTSMQVFTWMPALYSDKYEIHVKDLQTHDSIMQKSPGNVATVILKKNATYSWYVVSKSSLTPNTATSETWQFSLK